MVRRSRTATAPPRCATRPCAPAQTARASASRTGRSRPEDDFERGAAPGSGAEREAALDRLGARAYVLQPLPRGSFLTVEAVAVVGDRDEALAEGALPDRDLGPRCVRVLAHVREPFLDDAEDLDLLVRCELDRAVDLHLDLEPAVGGEDVDVPPQRSVERCRSAGRRERQDREAGLLLRENRRLLELRHRLFDRSPGLE